MRVRKLYSKRFCSIQCQNEWQKTNTGINNVRFTGSKIKCESCGKEYYEKKYKIEGKQHNFCGKACRQQWYSSTYSQSTEWKEASRIRATKLIAGNTRVTNTSPQIAINLLLDKLGINYANEENCKYYSIDNYLLEHNLMIEVMGDFWHCNPCVYDSVKQAIHKKQIPRDRAKHTYIKKYHKIEILYLWEQDIKKRPDVCENLILEYISNKGVLQNYHSFNYDFVDNIISLNRTIVIPYQDQRSEINA